MKNYSRLPIQAALDSVFGALLYLLPNKNNIDFPNNPKNILIIRATSIGDAVLTLPMIKELKKQTRAKITVVCGRDNYAVYNNQKFIDKIRIINNKNSNPFFVFGLISKLKKENFDIAIDTSQASNVSAFIAFESAKYKTGFFNPKTKSRNRLFDKIVNVDAKKHMVYNYLKLGEAALKKVPSKIELCPLIAGTKAKKFPFKRFAVIYARSTAEF